ncbi:MAG: Maf family protein [Geminicoccaceae bacterium]
MVLASSSPRRLALLRQVGIEPDAVLSPDIDETVTKGELPRAYAVRMAQTKALAAQATLEGVDDGYLLAADTVVACGRRILPKTERRDEAERCLRLLSGRRHQVTTAIAVVRADGALRVRAVVTKVRVKRLADDELTGYLASDEWHGKAGGYAIQGRAEALIEGIQGSYSNVVGLPVLQTVTLLRGLGWRPPA